jgi:hypothetical protein
MKVIGGKFSAFIETFNSSEELWDEGIDGVDQVGLEVVEVLHCAHFRHAQPNTDTDGQGMRNAC